MTVPVTIKHEKRSEAVPFCSNDLWLFSREANSYVTRTSPARPGHLHPSGRVVNAAIFEPCPIVPK